jgi:hypothetical protein
VSQILTLAGHRPPAEARYCQVTVEVSRGRRMDRWLEALAALGGFAAIGGLIDLAMYKAEKAKLKAKLEDWWLRFTDVRWSNFGRKESELAIQILDQWAGPKLWTRKRWTFSVDVTLFLLAMAGVWTVFRATWNAVKPDFDEPDRLVLAAYLLFCIVASLAFSLSLTRYIARIAAHLSMNALLSALCFALLVVVHILLLLYWVRFVNVLMYLPLYALAFALFEDIGRVWFVLSSAARNLVDEVWRGISKGDFDASFREWKLMFQLEYPRKASGGNPREFSSVVISFLKVEMDLVANGLRVLFAMLFLSSFLFRPLIQEPISRLWYGAMDSGKPVFTTLFGLLGAVVAATRVLAK